MNWIRYELKYKPIKKYTPLPYIHYAIYTNIYIMPSNYRYANLIMAGFFKCFYKKIQKHNEGNFEKLQKKSIFTVNFHNK